jgi:hypothetical protein
MRAFAAVAVCLLVMGCAGHVENLQANVDRTVLGTMVGRNYAEATRPPPELPLAPRAEPYGREFSVVELPDGSRLHRRLSRAVGLKTTTNFMGITQSASERFGYRLLYFRVDRAGVITDVANGYWLGETARCVGYVGNIFQTCDNPQSLAADVTFFDSLVRTADGRPITAWLGPTR